MLSFESVNNPGMNFFIEDHTQKKPSIILKLVMLSSYRGIRNVNKNGKRSGKHNTNVMIRLWKIENFRGVDDLFYDDKFFITRVKLHGMVVFNITDFSFFLRKKRSCKFTSASVC